jgi:hypothetical protein
MLIREYTDADLSALRRMHAAQGFGYAFPDLANPLFLTRLVLEDDGCAETAVRHSERSPAERDAARNLSVSICPDSAKSSANQREPRIVMAALLRLTCEAYLLHDPAAGSPRERWQNLLAMHDAVRADARARGLEDVHAFLPPLVERAFGRRLARLGWVRDPWASFCRRV